MATPTSVGRQAEDTALTWLENQGLELVTRNFSCKAGEIDLVMRDGHVICFVEVRYRSSRQHASGAESITRAKIAKLIRTAEVYLQKFPGNEETEYRFDVVSIDRDIEWMPGAFTAEGY